MRQETKQAGTGDFGASRQSRAAHAYRGITRERQNKGVSYIVTTGVMCVGGVRYLDAHYRAKVKAQKEYDKRVTQDGVLSCELARYVGSKKQSLLRHTKKPLDEE